MKWAFILIAVFCLVLPIVFSQDIVIEETELIQLRVNAFDEDGDNLTYNFASPFDEYGRWQTDYGDEGEYNIRVTVSDSKTETTENILIIVKHKNRPPVIENIPEEIIINEGETIIIEPKITDYENDDVDITISEPVSNGIWETGYEDAGEYNAIIRADDGIETVEKTIKIIVNDVNRIPVINRSYPEEDLLNIPENAELLFGIEADDADNDKLSYIWKIDDKEVSREKEYNLKTDYDSSGRHDICVDISDSKDLTKKCWKIDVKNINRIPVIDSITKSITVKESESVKLDFTAHDPDEDSLKYKVSLPIGNDLEWQTSYDDAGAYEIIVRISDDESEINETVNVVVEDVNRAPVFAKIKPVEINEGELFELQLTAEDPDEDGIVFSADSLPGDAELDENNSFKYTPGYGVVQKTKNLLRNPFDNKKEFVISFTASDGEFDVKQKLRITVKDVNLAPELEHIDNITADEGDIIKIIPNAVDFDSDDISYTVSRPFSSKGIWKTNYEDAGEYNIRITASDDELNDSQDITVIVNDVNRGPVIKEVKDIYDVYENNTIVIEPAVYDADNDTVEILIENLPYGAEFSDGKFEYTPDFDVVDNESEEVTINFTANDSKSIISRETTIIVYNTNRKPVILNSTQDKLRVYTNIPVLFTVDAEDPDGDNLTYIWKFGLLTGVKGKNILKRTFTTPGIKTIKAVASDGTDYSMEIFKVKVVEKKTPKKQTAKTTPSPVKNTVSGPGPVKRYIIE